MSYTALTLIKSAMRTVGKLGAAETPKNEDAQDALESMRFMLESWSANNLRIYYVTKEDLTFSSSPSTIGSGATLDTARPQVVLEAFLDDTQLNIIDYAKYLRLSLQDTGGLPGYLYYAPEFPNGKIYIWPDGSGTLHLMSLKPLTDYSALTSTVYFPPEYNEAIKWNLALRLCLEYGRQPSPLLLSMAETSLRTLESKNFNSKIPIVKPEIMKLVQSPYDIDEG